MTRKHVAPSKRKKAWFSTVIRFDNMARLKEIAAQTKAPVTQVLARLIQQEYDTLHTYSRKDVNAHDPHTADA